MKLVSLKTLAILAVATLSVCAQAQTLTEREDVRQFITELSTKHSIPAEEITNVLNQAEHLPKVIDYIRPPTQPGVRSWQRYRSRFIDRIRISSGVQFWMQHRSTIEAAQARYGVPAEIIVAIIGVETIYGRNTGSFNLVSALSTLAFNYPPRAELFRGELEALFLLAREQGRNPLDYRGSYAGALGLPQFLPSSVRNFAVDFDGDGRIDLLNSPVDAIGSVARFLSEHGWEKDGPIAVRAQLSPDANVAPLLQAGIQPRYKLNELIGYGVSADTQTPDAPSALIDLVTPGQATEYWLGYQNFYVITRYNRSTFYAMSVLDLARAVRTDFDLRAEAGTTR